MVEIDTDCTDSCKSNYAITTTTALTLDMIKYQLHIEGTVQDSRKRKEKFVMKYKTKDTTLSGQLQNLIAKS